MEVNLTCKEVLWIVGMAVFGLVVGFTYIWWEERRYKKREKR